MGKQAKELPRTSQMGVDKSIQVEILPWTERSLACLAESWQRLLMLNSANPSVSLSWSKVLVDAFELQEKAFVAIVVSDEEVVAIWPYLLGRAYRKKLPIREVKGLTSIVSYHPELLCLNSFDRHKLVQLIFDACHLEHGVDCMVLGTGQEINPPDLPNFEIATTTSPYLPIESTWTDFIASKPKKFRYKVRQRRKCLEQTEGLRHEWVHSSNWSSHYLDHILRVEQKSWKADKGIAISDRPLETRYYEILLPYLAREKALSLDFLFSKNEPITEWNRCTIKPDISEIRLKGPP